MNKILAFLFIVACLTIASFRIGKKETYVEISKGELKKELSTNYDNSKQECNWLYGNNGKYHLFKLVCSKKHANKGSILISRKPYKIKINKLKITTPKSVKELLPSDPFVSLKMNIKIDWNTL